MKVYWGTVRVAPRILNLGTRWKWVVRFTPRLLYPRVKDFLLPIGSEPSWAPEPTWKRRRTKNSVTSHVGNRTPVVQTVAYSRYYWDSLTPYWDGF